MDPKLMMGGRARLARAVFLACGVLVGTGAIGTGAVVEAQDQPDLIAINPGVRLAYTFGEGFTLGVELSVAVVPDIEGTDIIDLLKRGIGVGYGYVLSYDYTFAETRVGELHAGFEWIGPAIGLETGFSLVHDDEGRYFGFSITPWAGYTTIPYLSWTYVVGRDNLLDLGIMLKAQLCARDCPEGDDDDLFDD